MSDVTTISDAHPSTGILRIVEVPFNDPRRTYDELSHEMDAAIKQVLVGGRYLLGDQTEQFERVFAAKCGASYCVAVGNGTDALELALRSLGVGLGDEVITVANAGGYATTAIVAVGAVPVYVDVDPSNLTMDIDKAVEAVTAATAAIVATHLYGYTVDVSALRSSLEARGALQVRILEDAAQAHGGSAGGVPVGAAGDVAAFSFYPTKNLGALGDAGAILTNDPDVARRMRMLHQYGWASRYRSELPHGRNSRMDEIQAAILNVSLPYLDRWNDTRRSIVARYQTAAPTGVTMVHGHAPADRYVAHLAVARLAHRQGAREYLSRMGVATGVHYPHLDIDAPWMDSIPHRVMGLEESVRARDEILTLPCFPTLTDAEVAYVCEQLTNM